jgi:hypothetical protein
MEKKINIAELLKDCPKGMELDCAMFEDVFFDEITNNKIFPICIKRIDGHPVILTKYGGYANCPSSKCVIFPKGKTTWEGFVPPCKFKDGDIIADEHGNIAIYKGTMWYNKNLANYYCGYRKSDNHFLSEPKKDGHFGLIEELHLTTEEEKEKLFDAIKANGYKWNEETKTLETLVKPRFKVGDRIKNIYGDFQYDIKEVTDTHYTLVEVEHKFKYTEPIIEDKNWELVKFDINTLKPFDRVLVRLTNGFVWMPKFFSHYDTNSKIKYYPFVTIDNIGYSQCIPYEDNKHLSNTTDDCDEYYKNW